MEDEELMWGDPQWLEEEEEEEEEEQGDGKIIAAGLTAKEIAACCKVLDALAKDSEAFSRRELKPVRSSLQPHVHAMMSKQYSGSGPEGRAIERAKQAAANSFRQKQAAHDRNAIRATALREGRSRRLDELTAGLPEDHPHHLLVPDGVPLEDAATPAKICDGSKEVGGDGEAEADGDGSEDGEGGRTRERKETFKLQSCYVCKCRFSQLHHFYDRLCPACAEFNFEKRTQKADLDDYVAVVTGSRVKIGYHVCLKLLRMGATVVATTRFPMDSGERYKKERDYGEWSRRLHIVGLDLRDISALEEFAVLLKQRFPRVDILINNACQTIRRPTQYYSPLVRKEAILASSEAHNEGVFSLNKALGSAICDNAASSRPRPIAERGAEEEGENGGPREGGGGRGEGIVWSNLGGISRSAQLSQVQVTEEDEDVEAGGSLLPSGASDVNGQQLDLRRVNSWLLKVHQVSTSELLEVMLINVIAPFILTARVLPLMSRVERMRYIVHVSAMEGKFYRYKTPHHPHTNMAKAALNMLTRTSAEDLQKQGIFVNSVDTGWINDENPHEKSKRYADAANWQTAIDEIDAAARILDPVVTGVTTGQCPSGQFLKDFAPTEW